jgi:hypothetical protein
MLWRLCIRPVTVRVLIIILLFTLFMTSSIWEMNILECNIDGMSIVLLL